MPFSITINNEQEYPIIHLVDTGNGTEAEIFSFGGILNSFRISSQNGAINVIDGFSTVAEAIGNITLGFKSAKLSPFVCRLKMGKFTLNGTSYKTNKFYLGEHAIHGLLYDEVFSIKSYESTKSHASVTLECNYKGMDKGFPFPYQMGICWKLEKDNKLTVTTTINHDNNESIPIADGWHPYFTLGNSIDNCCLQINSNHIFEFNPDLLPTGKINLDNRFLNGRLLKDIELDNAFEIRNDTSVPACKLYNEILSLSIIPDSSYPILQVYTPDHRNSIALENLSGAPDNFNNGIGLVMLPPGETRSFETSYLVSLL